MARRSAKRRRMPTEMKAKAFAKMIEDDLTDEIEIQLNSFVRSVVSDLTSDGQKRGVSPVLTGFFASSWKAGLNRPVRNDSVPETKPRWLKIHENYYKDGSPAYENTWTGEISDTYEGLHLV